MFLTRWHSNNHSASQYRKHNMIQQTPLYACIVAEVCARSGNALSRSVQKLFDHTIYPATIIL